MSNARNLGELLEADGEVPSGKIDSVAASKLSGTIAAASFATGSIDSAHVAAGAVDDAHISGLAATKLTGTLPIDRIADDAITTAKLANSINDEITAALPKAGGTMTGVLKITDGSSSAPAIAFGDDTNTGIYSSNNDSVAIATGGYTRASFSSIGVYSYSNVSSGTNSSFRNYGGTWTANTGVTGNGFAFTNSVDGTAATISSTGNAVFTGTATATSFIGSGAGLTSVRDTTGGRKNLIINGGMRINQRGAGLLTINSGSLQYPCDRFAARGVSSAGVFTIERSSDSPAGFTNSLKATVTTADSSLSGTESYRIVQHIEGNNTSYLNWGSSDNQTATLSFKVKSSLTGTFGGVVQNGDYNRFVPFTYTISSANTWEDKTVTITGDTTGTYQTDTALAVRLNWSLGAAQLGTAGTYSGSALNGATGQTQVISTNGATWQVTGVQLELGSVATDFEHRSHGEELALCQRYFYNPLYNMGGARGSFVINYDVSSGNNGWITFTVPFPVKMRVSASFTHSLTPAKFLGSAAPANGDDKFAFYIQNQGYAGLAGNGSIANLSGGGVHQAVVGTYYCSPSSTSASHIFIGNGCTFQFNAEL
jgi:hypothetical protein